MQRRLNIGLLVALLLVTAVAMPFGRAQAAPGTEPYVGFRKQRTAADFAGSVLNGIALDGQDQAGAVRLASGGLTLGTKGQLYGVKSNYWYGTLESRVFDAPRPFDTAIASWNATTPVGTWLQLELRTYRPSDAYWTRWYNMGIWASGTGTIWRHSVDRQKDKDGRVATDSLTLSGGPVYTRYQYRLSLFTTDVRSSPKVRLVSVMTSNSAKEQSGLAVPPDRSVWGTELKVPQRSQMIYPNGGIAWCSPTSTSMVLAYWGTNVPVPAAASATYDYVYKGNGNWPFNTAWAASHGYEAYVTRLGSMSQVEQWIKAGVPVIVSYAYGRGELPGSPYPASGGHIGVVRGFDAKGNVIVNDPAAPSNARVRVVYNRAIFESLWLKHSRGTVYLVYPKGHPIPTKNGNGSW